MLAALVKVKSMEITNNNQGFRTLPGDTTPVDASAVSLSLQDCDSFAIEFCQCRICLAPEAEDLESFAVEVCGCQICKANTDKNAGQATTTLLSIA